jgi:hypothetical protein
VNRPGWVPWAEWVRRLRGRPWQVWAAAGGVFVLFAVLGAVTQRPDTAPTGGGRGLAEALERGVGPATSPAPAIPPAPGDPGHPNAAHPTPAAVASAARPSPTAAPGTAAFYPNCTAAEAAGVAPIRRGRPGYRSALDRDGDGIACNTGAAAVTSPVPTASGTPIPPNPPITSPTPDPTPDPTTDSPSPTAEPSTDPATPPAQPADG